MPIDRTVRSDPVYTSRFAPFLGHWTDDIGANQDGSVIVMHQPGGFAADLADLADPRAIRARHLSANQIMRDIRGSARRGASWRLTGPSGTSGPTATPEAVRALPRALDG